MSTSQFQGLLTNFRRIQVCSFDAGGGNVLSHIIRELSLETSFLVSGPSLSIYSGVYPNFENQNTESMLPDIDLLISSTGWQSDFEFNKMYEALERGITVIAVLDHWVNYRERFKRKNEEILPTYFVAVDDYAKSLLEDEYPGRQILLTENIFLKQSVENIRNRRKNLISFLYDFTFIGEPLSRSITNQLWDEFDALRNFFETLSRLDLYTARILIKPHPSENPEKYKPAIPAIFKNVQIDADSNIIEVLANSKKVVGCNSMALYLSDLSSVPTYTSLPEGVKPQVPISNAVPINSLHRIDL